MIDLPLDCDCGVALILVREVIAKISEGELDGRPSPPVIYLWHLRLESIIRLSDLNLAGYRDEVIWIPIVPENQLFIRSHADVDLKSGRSKGQSTLAGLQCVLRQLEGRPMMGNNLQRRRLYRPRFWTTLEERNDRPDRLDETGPFSAISHAEEPPVSLPVAFMQKVCPETRTTVPDSHCG
ncbi:hypothetical protein RBB73_01420 [Tunturiibacter empetritectus]|uniref:Uncharacterized protein n=1 Tax=Tunturiibacter empetritectus TaxID=3069691 RepID=A0A7W8INB5_9BACT|nr:hypothetical protein [Edaphobacter lichenicola]MBB5319313.1 hypothetical protein [Edaphobacter lichenicola]